jgi:hypothetical protein
MTRGSRAGGLTLHVCGPELCGTQRRQHFFEEDTLLWVHGERLARRDTKGGGVKGAARVHKGAESAERSGSAAKGGVEIIRIPSREGDGLV